MFDGASSVLERLVYQQGELTTVLGDLGFSSITTARSRGDVDLSRTREIGTERLADSGLEIYLIHNCRGIPTKEAMGRHIFQNR
jgi:hypothetical protein